MSLKRSQHSMEALSASFSCRSRSPTKSRRQCRSLHSSMLSTSSSSSSFSASWCEASLPLASAPRTVEIMWGGVTAPGFTLKRKRTGVILVSTVTHEIQTATSLKVGSELRLVGGFPVTRLSLQDVKKVMLMAPKPVSLVFVNADDVMIGHVDSTPDVDEFMTMPLCSSGSRSPALSSTMLSANPPEDSKDPGDDSGSDTSMTLLPAYYSARSESNESKKRKVSRLQVALDRFNRLLNRPVRQAGLHCAAEKSIVV